MVSQVSETFDIILKWENGAEISTLRFSPCSVSEFEIRADIQLRYGLNYQGPTFIQFQTCCYALGVRRFAENLRSFACTEEPGRLFYGSEDLELLSVRHVRGVHKKGATIAELRYRPFRVLQEVHFESELRVPLGPFGDLIGTARAFEEVIEALKMDCRCDPEHDPLPRRGP